MDSNAPIRGSSVPTQAEESTGSGLDNRIEGLLAAALQGSLSTEPDAAQGEQQQSHRAVVMRRTTTTRVVDQRSVLDALSASSAGLRDLVHRIRSHFQALADIEIRRILEAALSGEPNIPQPAAVESAKAPPLPSPGPSGPGSIAELAGAPDDDLYQGTVRLRVIADNLQRVVRFVDDLCQRPQLRMLRMSGGLQQEGAEVSLSLREPLPIRTMIASMAGVVSVDAGDEAEDEREVVVQLATALPAP